MKTLDDFVNLTPIQKNILTLFDKNKVLYENFFFIGGTLLKALNIVPRESNDLDFFTFPNAPAQNFTTMMNSIQSLLRSELGNDALVTTTKGFLHSPTGMVIEFIQDCIPPIDQFVAFGNIQTAGLKDIAANKASALCCRDELKDLIDIAFLTMHEGWLLRDLADFAEMKFRIGTVSEEKIYEELVAKKNMFEITPSLFLSDGEKNVQKVDHQIEILLQKTRL